MKYLPNVLVIDDDALVFEFIQDALAGQAKFHFSPSGQCIASFLQRQPIDLVFIDLHLPTISGHDIIDNINNYDESTQMVVVSASEEIEDAILAFRSGIHDYLKKPLATNDVQRVFSKCIKQNQTVKSNRVFLEQAGHLDDTLIIGNSTAIGGLKQQISQLTGSNIDVLITGESGTGKELVAKTLHAQEGNKTRPFVTLNCSAIPRELMESVLFGHEKGSFTGAVKKQIGKFELANGGDIFLDEIGTLPLELQAKLLRVLQEREIEPVGLGHSKKLQFRVIAATNENLVEQVKTNQFRKDLYYRLNKATIQIPPLRARKDDLPTLIDHFLHKHTRNPASKKAVTPAAMNRLTSHDWPGNVRELENIMENLIFTLPGQLIDIQHLANIDLNAELFDAIAAPVSPADTNGLTVNLGTDLTLEQTIKNVEKVYIARIVDESESKQQAATKLAIDRKTLFRKIKLYNI